jgi:hypothetical protein
MLSRSTRQRENDTAHNYNWERGRHGWARFCTRLSLSFNFSCVIFRTQKEMKRRGEPGNETMIAQELIFIRFMIRIEERVCIKLVTCIIIEIYSTCNLDYPDTFVQGAHAVSKVARKLKSFSLLICLGIQQNFYIKQTSKRIHKKKHLGLSFLAFSTLQTCLAPLFSNRHTHWRSMATPSMHAQKYIARTWESPDNRGCTVSLLVTVVGYVHVYYSVSAHWNKHFWGMCMLSSRAYSWHGKPR